MDINALIQTQASAHPFYAFAIGCIVGPLWPKIVTWLVTDGVDLVVPKLTGFQKFYLSKIGATNAQISATEKAEAQAFARAAEDIKKDADATGAASPVVPPPAP